ncbi:coronin-7-like, partial [Polyodon spathula]|uniref:coronin-7-like n=1 Tax=Polyodon spathula TaxID=7913 RepID=UPI001B7DA967
MGPTDPGPRVFPTAQSQAQTGCGKQGGLGSTEFWPGVKRFERGVALCGKHVDECGSRSRGGLEEQRGLEQGWIPPGLRGIVHLMDGRTQRHTSQSSKRQHRKALVTTQGKGVEIREECREGGSAGLRITQGFLSHHSFSLSLSLHHSFSLALSPRTLIPLFDPDTGLLVLAGMGDCVMHCFEVTASQPVLSQVNQCLTEAATRGIAMVPKLAVDVTSCEVMRVLQLTDSFIVPVSYSVPRKSGQDFHGDLYPDTPGDSPALPAEEWWSGGNKQVQKVSLDPAKRPIRSFSSAVIPCSVGGVKLEPTNQPTKKELPIEKNRKEEDASGQSSSSSLLTSPTTPSSLVQSPSTPSEPSSSLGTSCSQRSLQSILGPSSKLRHTQSLVLHRDTHITNLKGLNLTTPGECDGFCVNSKRVAVPLASAGGQIAVLELSQPGRLPDSAIPTIQNGVAVADFSWDPFEPRRLAVAGEDAKIRVWLVPEGGLKETVSEPQCILQGHTEKIYSLKFHPLASGIIASSSYDLTVRLWDLGSGREVRVLQGHQDQIFSLAWSPDGQFLATV